MARIIWERGEAFKAGECYGIVLDDLGTALVLTSAGPLAYRVERKREPPDMALPAEVSSMPKDIQLALDVAVVAAGHTSFIKRSIKNHTLERSV